MVVAPVTTAGIYEAPQELAGAASGLTNAMHQIGGPIGLSIIMSVTTNFYSGMQLMALFTIIGIVLVCSLIYQFGHNK